MTCLFALPLWAFVRSPLFNILGSYFPGWMLCLLIGILLTVLLRVLVRKWNADEFMEPASVTYLALAVFFTFTLWLVIFA
jgi:ABC-type uncharacterized transport system permease subunit